MVMSLMSLSTTAFAKTKFEENDLGRVLKTPLILGASVSADHSTESPGKRLAKRYTTPDSIATKAIGGRAGRDLLSTLPTKIFEGRSAILAIDLFFWDSTLRDPAASLAALDKLVAEVRQRKIPIVIGEIPELIPGRQPQRVVLNKAIRKACESYEGCFVMPLDHVLKKVLKDWSLEIKGRRYSLAELVPDGLHVGSVASDYLADLMKDTLLGKDSK